MGQSSEKVGLCTVYQIETTILMIARIRIAALMLGIDNNKITPSLLSALQIALKDKNEARADSQHSFRHN